MGNAFSEPYQQTEYQSGASRFLNSIFMAICVAPLLILGMCVMLGWNERQAVCSQRAISAGKDVVKTIDCDNAIAQSGSLVTFSCDIDKKSLAVLQGSSWKDFSGFQYQQVGISIESYMYQCVEESQKHDQKVQGGGKKTVTTYTYKKDWRKEEISSGQFGTHSPQARDAFNSGCGGNQNKRWDERAPKSTKPIYQQQMKVGAFTTMSDLIQTVPIDTPVDTTSAKFSTPSSWQKTGTGSFYLARYGGQPSHPQVGDMKVVLKSSNPNNMKQTVLGKNEAGTINKWIAPSSWLCSGYSLYNLRQGTISKDDLFTQLSNESTGLTWTLRLIGFIVMWVAFCLCFGPLEVAGDCIPCVGPFIGDSIAAISCCVACLPATACTLGVAGAVWVVMRPLIGIPCMIAFVIIIGGFVVYIGKQKAAKRGGPIATGIPNPNYGAAYPQAYPSAPIAQGMPLTQGMPMYQGMPRWNPNALCDGSTAQDRVIWLQQNQGMSVAVAQQKVMSEFPSMFC